MNKRDAYKLGVSSGYEAGTHGEFTMEELASEDAFLTACAEICDNKRQYAGSPTYDFAREANSEGLFDAFDEGESVGARKAWRDRRRRAKEWNASERGDAKLRALSVNHREAKASLAEFAHSIADDVCRRVNAEAAQHNPHGAVIYATQFTLEEVIKILQERV